MRNVADYFTPTTNTEKEVRSKLKEGRGGEKNKRGKGSKANRSKETKRNRMQDGERKTKAFTDRVG